MTAKSTHPGDNVRAEVQFTGTGIFNLTLHDLASGQSATVSRTNLRAFRQSAEWVVKAPATANHQSLPLAPFDTVSFSNSSVTIGGQTSSILSKTWQHGALIMESLGGIVRTYPSGLNADGSAFSVTWRTS